MEQLRKWIGRFHRNDSGAVILLCLAAFMALFMMSMVIWDSIGITSEKIHLQTATDSAAYSQSAVRARTMNMMALSNVGKRMTVGMMTSYINVNQWMKAIKDYSILIAAVCTVVTAGAGASVCGQIASGSVSVYYREGRDRRKLYSKSVKCAIEKWSCSWSGCGWDCWVRWPSWVEYAAPDYDGFGDLINAIASAGGTLPSPIPGPLAQMMNGSLNLGVVKIHNLPEDIYRWSPKRLIGNFYGRELQAFDNYQNYMNRVAPYWAWTEGVIRGLGNRAPVTVSYPSPESTPHKAGLPIKKAAWRQICKRAHEKDREFIFADHVLKNLGAALGGAGGIGSALSQAGRYGSVALAGLFMAFIDSIPSPIDAIAPRTFDETCKDVTGKLLAKASSNDEPNIFGGSWWWNPGPRTQNFRDFGRPYLLERYDSESEWLMQSSNLTFGFRPNASKMNDDQGRGKYGILSEDYVSWMPRAGGTWTMSRGEIAFQGGTPSMWEPQWTARIRPVALPGEWRGLGQFDLHDAYSEVNRELAHVTTTAHVLDAAGQDLLTHPHQLSQGASAFGQLVEEARAIERATRSMSDDAMDGVPK